jgi:hypothetical protein
MIQLCVLGLQTSHLLLICTNSGCGIRLLVACACQGYSASGLVFGLVFLTEHVLVWFHTTSNPSHFFVTPDTDHTHAAHFIFLHKTSFLLMPVCSVVILQRGGCYPVGRLCGSEEKLDKCK